MPPVYQDVARCGLADTTKSLSKEEFLNVADRYSENTTIIIKGFWYRSLGTHPKYKAEQK